jgi:hypothetical protein
MIVGIMDGTSGSNKICINTKKRDFVLQQLCGNRWMVPVLLACSVQIMDLWEKMDGTLKE